MCKEAHENLDMRMKMKHEVIDGLQDATEMVAVVSTPAHLQEITPCRSSSDKRKAPPSMVRMNLGISEGNIESGNVRRWGHHQILEHNSKTHSHYIHMFHGEELNYT